MKRASLLSSPALLASSALLVSCSYVTGESMYAPTADDAGGGGVALVSSVPPSGGKDVPLGAAITLTFAGYPDPASLGSFGGLLLSSGKNTFDLSATVDLVTESIVVQPRLPLTPNTSYVLELTSKLRALGGQPIAPTAIAFTTGSTPGGGPAPPTTRSLAKDVQPLLDASCATLGCHDSQSKSEGLSLAAGETRTSAVDVPAAEVPQLSRVKTNDPASSYLLRKILGTPDILPSRMPVGVKWPTASARIVSDWIATGAAP